MDATFTVKAYSNNTVTDTVFSQLQQAWIYAAEQQGDKIEIYDSNGTLLEEFRPNAADLNPNAVEPTE